MEIISNNDLENILDNKELFEGETPSTPDDFENSPLFNENEIPDSMVNEDEQIVMSPIVTQRDNLTLGLSPEDIKSLYDYLSGKAEKPLFIDKFTSDTEGRLRDMVYMMNLLQLSSLPILLAYQQSLRERLFTPENLYAMDIKDLTTASNNISKEIQGILDSSTKSVLTFNQFGSVNSEYRDVLNKLMLMPADKYKQIKDIVFSDSEKE